MSAAALKKPAFGVIAEFASATKVYEAAEKVRDAGFKFWDVHSPFPDPRNEQGDGPGKSPLGYIIFCGGFLGFTTAVLLEYIPSSFLFPADRSWQTGELFHRPAIFSDHVRVDDFDLGFHRVFRCFCFEPTASACIIRSLTTSPLTGSPTTLSSWSSNRWIPNFQRSKLENSWKELAAPKSPCFTRMIKNFLIGFHLVTIITIALLGFQGTTPAGSPPSSFLAI